MNAETQRRGETQRNAAAKGVAHRYLQTAAPLATASLRVALRLCASVFMLFSAPSASSAASGR